MTKKPLIILSGPTAVGKTALSIALAKLVNGCIISADSMQIYKHMDIGSAKIMPDEMCGIKHYLIDELMPDEEFHIVRFQQMAKKAMDEIYAHNRIPIVVGGTGFYIQALLYDIDFSDQESDNTFRKELVEYTALYGNEALHDRLRKVDPESAEKIHANNVKRVIRALEFYEQTKRKISEHNEEEQKKESPYNFVYFVLTDDRATIYNRIEKRVDIMVENGLIEEVTQLKNMGYHRNMVSMQGLGYKEILDYLDQKCSKEEAIAKIKLETRHFAKRQLTWFRREQDVYWLDKQNYHHNDTEILEEIKNVLIDKGILKE